ncbi:dolichyl-phosphate beta-D-mannosyltransferase [Halococcus morrhuae DSM 1307]|uniref:Dolichyl-phosphate beta-D-mannosyltransferase n=1 Tax=Halococcus morrhuae DSM 1307 TaxID=931277 RepID=M0MMJ2_HALMO|nr:GtrA family protein [Halococcus morrhuae]EMA45660.1 dolichyl-phosphate beta-D-mannosyltransferase [Halococcus morrhuae DSM 1307]
MSVLDELSERSLFDPQNKRLVMYVAVGLVGLVINQGLTVGLPRFGVPYVIAGLAGRIISTLANYVLNDSWTWRGRGAAGFGQWCWRAVKYVATRLVGIAIGTVGLVVIYDFLGVPLFWANLVSMGLGLLWGFGASEKWVWSTEDSSLSLDSIKRYVGEDKRE